MAQCQLDFMASIYFLARMSEEKEKLDLTEPRNS